jgi:type VI secretion system protein VasG
VIPYYPIRSNVLRQIIELKLEKIGKRLEGAYRIAFNYSETLVDHIGEQCVESENGARSVDQILSGALLPEISRRLLNAAATKSSFQRLFVDLSPSGAVRYTLE